MLCLLNRRTGGPLRCKHNNSSRGALARSDRILSVVADGSGEDLSPAIRRALIATHGTSEVPCPLHPLTPNRAVTLAEPSGSVASTVANASDNWSPLVRLITR